MPVKYNMYIGIKDGEIELFQQLWNEHSVHLEPMPTMIHQADDKYAAVFNTWIRYTRMGEPLIVKPNRIFVNGSVHAISLKLQKYMPSIIRQQIIDHVQDANFMFIHSYHLTRNVMILLEKYLQENNALNKYISSEYYSLEDEDIIEGNGINLLIKEIMYGFIHQYLTAQLIRTIYYETMQQTKDTLQNIICLKELGF